MPTFVHPPINPKLIGNCSATSRHRARPRSWAGRHCRRAAQRWGGATSPPHWISIRRLPTAMGSSCATRAAETSPHHAPISAWMAATPWTPIARTPPEPSSKPVSISTTASPTMMEPFPGASFATWTNYHHHHHHPSHVGWHTNNNKCHLTFGLGICCTTIFSMCNIWGRPWACLLITFGKLVFTLPQSILAF